MRGIPTPNRSVESLLFHWPAVVRSAEDDWAKTFARSIARQSRRAGWTPTSKQHGMMEKMVAELFAFPAAEDGEVIDHDC